MTIAELRTLGPYERSVEAAKLSGEDRGRLDAEIIAEFLGGTASRNAYKHKVYNLADRSQALAHSALVEGLGVEAPDFGSVPEESYVVEPLGFEGRLLRQLINQGGESIAYYIASVAPFEQTA